MFDFLEREDVRNKMIGLTAFNCIIISYQCWKKRNNYCKKMEQVQKAPVYEFQEFIDIQKQKKKNSSSAKRQNEYQAEKEGFCLVKMKPNGKPFVCHQQKIYSNQIAFCPPSSENSLKLSLKEYQKTHNSNPISLQSLLKNKYQLFNGKILTDKISYKTTFVPETQFKPNLDQNFIFVLWQYFLWFELKAYEIFSYFAQALLQKLNFIKKYKRSKDPNRAPLIKGVFSGLLYTYFSFLTGSSFLLKVNFQGNQFSTQLIADNKLMIMDFYSKQIKKQTWFIAIAATISIAAFSFLIYRSLPWLKIYWRNWTKKELKKINTSKLTDDKICQICYVNCRNVIFFKCRHLVVCEQCFWHLNQNKCIICNEIMDDKTIIFPMKN